MPLFLLCIGKFVFGVLVICPARRRYVEPHCLTSYQRSSFLTTDAPLEALAIAAMPFFAASLER